MHYLIFRRCPGSHSYVDFARAETPLAALQQFLLGNWGQQLSLREDGSVSLGLGSRTVSYPHPLSLIEAEYKTQGEWKIREFPPAILNADFAEGFCGEDVRWIDTYFDACRPHLRREFPRSRAKAFLWYLHKGVLVTFYRRKSADHIETLRRFRHHWDGHEQKLTIEPWDGGYDDLLAQLSISMYVSDIAP